MSRKQELLDKWGYPESFPTENVNGEDIICGEYSSTLCTSYAHYIAKRENSIIIGIFKEDYESLSKDNPAIFELADGHDMALVDGRYIVDPWPRFVAGDDSFPIVLDVEEDEELILKLYGDISLWEKTYDFTRGTNRVNESIKRVYESLKTNGTKLISILNESEFLMSDKNRLRLIRIDESGNANIVTKKGIMPINEDYFTPQTFVGMDQYYNYDYYMPMLMFYDNNNEIGEIDDLVETGSLSHDEIPTDMLDIIKGLFERGDLSGDMPDSFITVKLDMEHTADTIYNEDEDDEYLNKMVEDIELLPPVIIAGNRLIDGRYRLHAHKVAERSFIEAIDLTEYVTDKIKKYPPIVKLELLDAV